MFILSLSRSWRTFLCCAFCLTRSALIFAHDLHPVRIPLTFEPNEGQADKSARFLARSGRGTVFLTNEGPTLIASHGSSVEPVRLHLLNAAKVVPVAESPTGGFTNYYTSSDRKRWLSHIPLFSRVHYVGIYPGIDAVFHGNEDQLEYDFEVSPGGNPDEIVLRIEGAERSSIVPDGSLEIISGGETWHLLPPVAYQQRGSKKQPIQVRYSLLKNSTVALQVGEYDSSSLLIIDPVVESAGFLPSAVDDVVATQLDAQGNFVVTGVFGSAVGIVKVNPTGTSIIYSTQIGTANGAYPSTVNALALDGNGNAYIAGTTSAPDFPVTSNLAACGQSCGGGFAAKFAPDGSLTYSTILGSVLLSAITTDSGGNAYVAGSTQNNSLQTVNAFQPVLQCTGCVATAFYAKLNPAGTAYLFSSYFYGSIAQTNGKILATAIALDSFGNILIAGMTNCDPPLVNPWQSGVGGIFFSKFAPDGRTLIFSTRFGSSQNLSESTPAGDALTGMSIGSDGTVFLVGYTQSQDFPYTINSPQHPIMPSGYASGVSYMFATAIDPTLSKLTYSAFLGQGFTTAVTIGPKNHLYITGTSTLFPFPLENQVVSDISTGGFYMELDQSGVPVTVSQFGGRFYAESPPTIAVDTVGDIYLVGLSSSTVGSVAPVNHFRFPGEPDPILVGSGVGSSTGGPFAIISPTDSPQLSLDTVGPFLTLRNAGSADLHISNITLSGGLAKMWGNCGNTIPATTSCILTVSDSNGKIATGSVTIVSDAQPAVRTFTVTASSPLIIGNPIRDQLWSPDTRLVYLYPPQFEGTLTGSIPIPVWNVGTTKAIINSINIGGSLSETDNCGTQISGGATLAPGSSCTLQVSLTSGGSQPSLSFIYDANQKENNYIFVTTPTTQQLTLSASSINFGTQQVNGVAIPRVVTATNTGDSALSAPSVSIQGDPEFALTGNSCNSSVAPHQSCVVAVQFSPIVDGAPAATLSISGQQVTLNGQGQIGSLIQLSPLELDFPPVIMAKTNALPLTLTNISSAVVGITGISFSLGDFTETDNCQSSVPTGGTCNMQVSFSPQQLGVRRGYLTIGFSNGVLAQIVTLTGSGVTPFQVSPSSLDFGSTTTVGSASVAQSISIGNGMQSTPQPYALAITGDFVIAQNPCSQSPMPGFQGCALQISFQPKTLGPQQGALTISYPGLSGQSIVTLTGSAVAPQPVFSSPSTLTFGNRILGSTIQQTVTISNAGNTNLLISGLALGGANASDFQVAGGQCSSVAPGMNCGIQVGFTPSAVGQRLATLNISDNAQNSPQSVALSGSGVSPFTMQMPSGSSSVVVTRGGSATYQITVSASPGFTGVVQFGCTGAPQNATCSVQPASVDFSISSSANIIVTISTTGATTAFIAPGSPLFLAVLLFMPVIFCFRRRLTITAPALVLMVMLLGVGCGGGSTQTPSSSASAGTPPGTYTLNVTGSSGTQTQSIALTLAVQ